MNAVTGVQWGIVAYWVGAVADMWTTWRGLKSGRFREANPVLGPIINRFGNAGLLAVKILAFIVLMFFGSATPLVIVGALWFAVACWNAYQLRKVGVL